MYAIRSYYAPPRQRPALPPTAGRQKARGSTGPKSFRVITSYSIHYTKLYDGIAGTLLANDSVKLGMTADLSVPTFQNLVFDAGLEAVVKDASYNFV